MKQCANTRLGRPTLHASSPGSPPGLGEYYSRCENLDLYIRDCESLCLSDETVKAVGPFYRSGVYARGSKRSHTGGKCVTCRGLHILTYEGQLSKNHSCVSPKLGCLEYTN